ncbi:YdcH family protein [Bordetella genomosp. 12]|uniref:DUF465 domain-containing protein n=1 Tax=Bordetella genomosp. 12 TaxID=463035 RepID=A0A261VAB5_9BORD|nr:YdcH family protein [Bordetella genomosp. 12]OZI71106.1 hypothetical protein CAL22_14640 [Bordetella genomosp. 12]
MFPEFREQISRLKTENPHFAKLFDKHNQLDQQIQNMEAGRETATPLEIEKLKKEKLHIKDQLYVLLKEA